MGTAPISIDNLPDHFDLRSANAHELRLLKEGKLTQLQAAVGAAAPEVRIFYARF